MPPPRRPGLVVRVIVALIRAYSRVLSPLLGANCRYHPTCSSYARQSLETHGLVSGGWMAIRRIGRCHPFREGGYDPVPGSVPVDAGSPATIETPTPQSDGNASTANLSTENPSPSGSIA